VLIESRPGSTIYNHTYDLAIDETTTFSLVDTPGFQNARRALAWIETYQQDNVDQNITAAQAVRAFLQEEADNSAFQHEIRLLTPILTAGAGILYVVNGTQPYLSRYEAEMRILALTGAPRLGVINIHGTNSPHADAWEEALKPYFKVTRFDALGATATQRQQLFASFRGVDDSWAPMVDKALDHMQRERLERHHLASAAICSTIIDILTMQEEAPLTNDREQQTRALAKKLFHNIRQREQECRHQVAELYRHYNLATSEKAIELLEADLLDRDKWQLMGLSNRQLASAGATAGAVAGGVIDAGVGGASFFVGTAIGAVVGSIGALWGGHRLAKVRVMGHKLGGKRLRIEAPDATQFAFVLLDRALLHWHQVAGRAHARRDQLTIDTTQANGSLVSQFNSATRKKITRLLTQVRSLSEPPDKELRDDLKNMIDAIGPDQELPIGHQGQSP
jgi:hypothetical protein